MKIKPKKHPKKVLQTSKKCSLNVKPKKILCKIRPNEEMCEIMRNNESVYTYLYCHEMFFWRGFIEFSGRRKVNSKFGRIFVRTSAEHYLAGRRDKKQFSQTFFKSYAELTRLQLRRAEL